MARTSPSVVCLTNSRSSQSNRFRTVFDWENLSTNLDANVGQRPSQVHPSTYPTRTIDQSFPITRLKVTKKTSLSPLDELWEMIDL